MFAYLVFFAPLLGRAKHETFVRYHVRQGAGLLITALVLQGALSIISYWISGASIPLVFVVRVLLLALLIIGVGNAANGRMNPLPVVGKYAEKAFN